MSNGGAQHKIFGPFFYDGSLQSQPKLYHYASGGTVDKDIWSDEGKTSALAQPFVGDTNGLLSFKGDGEYHFVVKNNAGTVTLLDIDGVRLTKDDSGIWEGSHGSAYPAALSSSIGHLFPKIVAAKISGLGVNASGSDYTEILSFDSNGDPIFSDLLTKGPAVNIVSFGAAVGNTAADNGTAIQAAIDYAEANGGYVYTPPLGSFHTTVVTTDSDEMMFVGSGFKSEWKLDSSAGSGTVLLKATNTRKIKIFNMAFNGNNIANNTHLIEFIKSDSGTFMNLIIDNCYFYNHQGDSAVKFTGSAGNVLTPVVISNCIFYDMDNAIHMQYCQPKIRCNWFNSINKSVTAKPIYLEDCTYGSVFDNYANTWGANVAGIHLDGCTYILVSHNSLAGTMAWGILTDDASNYNIITNNDVSGAHTTAALANSGGNSIIHSNLGSSVFQNGQIISSGATGIDDYNYKLYDSEATTAEGTSNGQLNDSSVTFNDIIAVDDPSATTYDYVHLPNLTKYKWVLFPVRSINSITQLQLGASDQWDTPITIPDNGASSPEGIYDLYTNLAKPGIWESLPFATLSLATAGATLSNSGTLSGVTTEKEFLLLIFKEGAAGGSTATDINITLEAYKDIVSGDNFQTMEAVNLTSYTDTEFARMLLYSDDQKNDITIRLYQTSAGNAYVDVEVYRLKRNVDA